MSSIFENRVAFGAKWSYFCKKHWICACNFIVQTQAHFSIKFRYWELFKLFVYTICHVKIKRKFRYRYVRENGMYFYNFSPKIPNTIYLNYSDSLTYHQVVTLWMNVLKFREHLTKPRRRLLVVDSWEEKTRSRTEEEHDRNLYIGEDNRTCLASRV